MCDLSFPFVHDLIVLAVLMLLFSLVFSAVKRALYCSVHSRFVSRETNKPLKSWCYDENEI